MRDEARRERSLAERMEHRLHALEVGMQAEHRLMVRWKKGFAIMSALALVSLATAAVAITVTQSSYSGVSGETVSYDSSLFTVSLGGVLVNALAQSEQGTSGSPVELALVSAGRTALGAGNWTYQISAAELTDGSVPSATYKADLFVNGTSKGSIYFKQDTDTVGVETLTLTWDIGATLGSGDAYTVRIETV